MKTFVRALLAGAILLAPVTGEAGAQAYGPLTAEEGSPLQRLSYTPMTEAADPVPRGALRADAWMGYSNIFEHDSTAAYVVFMDMERLINTVTVRYGLTDRIEVGGRVTLETTGGGALDDFLTWWHGLLHVPNSDRDLYPSGGFEERLEAPRGAVLVDVPRHTLALEDVRLFAKARVFGSGDGSKVLSLRAVSRVPAQGTRVGRERSDVAVTLVGRRSWDAWHVHAMLGASTVRASPELAGVLEGPAWYTMWGVERRLSGSVSAVVQYGIGAARVPGFESRRISRPPGDLVFGAAGRLGEHWRWDVSFQEDVPPISPAIDFTLGVRVSRTFRGRTARAP